MLVHDRFYIGGETPHLVWGLIINAAVSNNLPPICRLRQIGEGAATIRLFEQPVQGCKGRRDKRSAIVRCDDEART
jgi:hypothetical protein